MKKTAQPSPKLSPLEVKPNAVRQKVPSLGGLFSCPLLHIKLIPLTRGKFAIVDDEDYEGLNQYHWCLVPRKGGNYHVRHYSKDLTIYMHRMILNVPTGLFVDHINHNGLDNRWSNLRVCTRSQNQHNRKPHGLSKYKGVAWHAMGRKWVSRIAINGRQHYLGLFKTEIEAANAYKKAAKQYHKEFMYVS